jgi:hypothetical protein
MNKIKRYFLKRKKKKQFLKYLDDQKTTLMEVFYKLIMVRNIDFQKMLYKEQMLLPLWYRVLDHDDDLCYKPYFEIYRKHFYPVDLEEKIFNLPYYAIAEFNRMQENDYKWQFRMHYDEDQLDKETKLACLENILDWIAKKETVYNMSKAIHSLPKAQKEFMMDIVHQLSVK